MKKIKGISPVIAAIVLIGVALVIGVMVSTWVSTYTTTTTAALSTCAGVTTFFTLESATYTSSSGILSVKLTNRGTDDVYNFTIEAENATGVASVAVDGGTGESPAATYHITQGRSYYIKGNQTGLGTITKLTVVAQSCPAYVPTPVSVTSS